MVVMVSAGGGGTREGLFAGAGAFIEVSSVNCRWNMVVGGEVDGG